MAVVIKIVIVCTNIGDPIIINIVIAINATSDIRKNWTLEFILAFV